MTQKKLTKAPLIKFVKLWLAFKIYGNGYGLAMPAFNGELRWLEGEFYHLGGGFGAQLTSFEFSSPSINTRRVVAGQEIKPFCVSGWFLKRVSWARCRDFKDFEEVREFWKILRDSR